MKEHEHLSIIELKVEVIEKNIEEIQYDMEILNDDLKRRKTIKMVVSWMLIPLIFILLCEDWTKLWNYLHAWVINGGSII